MLALVWGFAQFKLDAPPILNSLVVIGPSVLGALLTVHLARTSYSIVPNGWLRSLQLRIASLWREDVVPRLHLWLGLKIAKKLTEDLIGRKISVVEATRLLKELV